MAKRKKNPKIKERKWKMRRMFVCVVTYARVCELFVADAAFVWPFACEAEREFILLIRIPTCPW